MDHNPIGMKSWHANPTLISKHWQYDTSELVCGFKRPTYNIQINLLTDLARGTHRICLMTIPLPCKTGASSLRLGTSVYALGRRGFSVLQARCLWIVESVFMLLFTHVRESEGSVSTSFCMNKHFYLVKRCFCSVGLKPLWLRTVYLQSTLSVQTNRLFPNV